MSARLGQFLATERPARSYEVFSALGDPRRVFIMKLLLGGRDRCVSDIAEACKISVPAASQQLKILERAALVCGRREGRQMCFDANMTDPVVRQLIEILAV